MIKIYDLLSNNENTGFFIEIPNVKKEYIQALAMSQNWKKFTDYHPASLELIKGDNGYKNYKLDFCAFSSPFFIFSENAVNALREILEPRGQFLDVITESKRKKFIGYYPTNVYSEEILDIDKSDYLKNDQGLMLIRKPVLFKEKIPDEYLFTIKQDRRRVYVTDKFKKLVEDNNLVGFEFSEYNEVELSSYK